MKKLKNILLILLMVISINTFSQTITEIKKDVINYGKTHYSLFKPLEWSNYKLVNSKFIIYNEDVYDSSSFKLFDLFMKGDTNVINKLNNLEYSFNYSYQNFSDGPDYNYFYLSSMKFGKIVLNNKICNYIISNATNYNSNSKIYWTDTLYFTYKNKTILNQNNDTITIQRYIDKDNMPLKPATIKYILKEYEIRLIYNSLSKGGDIRIYNNIFKIYYKSNGKLFIITKEETE